MELWCFGKGACNIDIGAKVERFCEFQVGSEIFLATSALRRRIIATLSTWRGMHHRPSSLASSAVDCARQTLAEYILSQPHLRRFTHRLPQTSQRQESSNTILEVLFYTARVPSRFRRIPSQVEISYETCRKGSASISTRPGCHRREGSWEMICLKSRA